MIQDGNFFGLLGPLLLESPDAPCLVTAEEGMLSRSWLDAMSARYAHALHASGCRPGDRVATQVDKSPHALALFYACLRAGFVVMPLNTAYRSAELAYLIEDGSPTAFVGASELRTQGLPADASLLTLDGRGGGTLSEAAARMPAAFESHRCSGEAPACLVYTSGTTGRPKGAVISHRAMVHAATTLGRAWAFAEHDVLLHALPLFHAHGLMIAANVALAAGARIVLQRKFDLDALVDALPRCTVFMGVPTFYHRMLDDPRIDARLCAGMRLFTCGSAPLSAEVLQAFQARTGQVILERYGTTETMILCANPLQGERRAGSVGRPIDGVELRIAGADDRELAQGQIGMIQVRGTGLFSGYWNLPEQTRLEFTADGWFRTGDLGVVDPMGYVTITGRAKDLVISGGYNVYPAEVETALNAMDAVKESAIVGVPHPDFGEAVVAFVIPADANRSPDPTEVIRWAKERLANYKVPKQVHVVAEFPRNAMGKVLKKELREVAVRSNTVV